MAGAQSDFVTKDTQPQIPPFPAPSRGASATGDKVPLCVDLDGTLVDTDCLWEGCMQMLFRDFRNFARIACGFWRGRAWFKRQISQHSRFVAGALPFNSKVIALITTEKAAGRQVLLVTASDQSIADSVAAHLKLFDAVIGSDGVTNLRGRAKAALLVEKFGRGGFDYAGNSVADIPVWKAARHAYVVRPSLAVKFWLSGRQSDTTILE
jgi:phosphoserine phosphatase